MDPVDEFRDLCVSEPSAPSAPSAPQAPSAPSALFRDEDIRREVRAARPRFVVVYGRAGSGRSHVADVARRAMDGRYVEVDETYAHSVNVTLTRRALDKHIAAAPPSLRRVYVLLARYERCTNGSNTVLPLCTVDYIDECVLRERYGVGIQRFLRNYGGSVVQMHNHRAFGIEPAMHRFAPALLEPRSSLLVERMFRAQRGDPEAFSFADALVSRYERDEEELPELVVEVLAAVLRKRQPERVRGAHRDEGTMTMTVVESSAVDGSAVGPISTKSPGARGSSSRGAKSAKGTESAQREGDDELADLGAGDVARDEHRDVVVKPVRARNKSDAPVRRVAKKKVDRADEH